MLKFDHDFIGRQALEAVADQSHRGRVTLVWNAEDVVRVYASQFGDGPRFKSMEFFAAHAVHAKRLQTDNAFVYVRNASLRDLLADRAIQHRRIPPRTPKRNGKVERYQQTLAREWAYGQRYRHSDARAAALPIWLKHYNYTRNHSSLSNRPPITRVRNEPRHNT